MNNKPKKVCFCTLGCKVNQYETNAMKQKMIENGYEVVEENADIYVVNTCTVTNISDRKSRNMLKRVKKQNPNSIVVAAGCYAQTGKEELEKMDEIDIIIGNNEKGKIVEYIQSHIREKEVIVTDVMHKKEFVEFGSTTYTDKTRAVIKVQDGCDRFCSYCLIPYARGRVRSRNLQNIIEEIKEIAKKGIKEVVITGIHIASYGKDFKEECSLIDLLEKINEIEGIRRIRLGSIEPTLITETFIERLKKLDKICQHFHLSLQSGCDSTLKRMNRRYTTEEFRECVDILRKNYKDVILTTDIIVGFPGETEEEFDTTYCFLNEIGFYKIHVFKYSPRKGTKAAEMENQIDGNIKEKRIRKLISMSKKKQEEINQNYIGRTIEVLFEENDGEFIKGHTQNYIMVKLKNNKKEGSENQIKSVEIIDADKEYLIGKV